MLVPAAGRDPDADLLGELPLVVEVQAPEALIFLDVVVVAEDSGVHRVAAGAEGLRCGREDRRDLRSVVRLVEVARAERGLRLGGVRIVRRPAQVQTLERVDVMFAVELGHQQIAVDLVRSALEEARKPEGAAVAASFGLLRTERAIHALGVAKPSKSALPFTSFGSRLP